MSTALRIASVTYVLKDLLNNGLINHDVTGVIGEAVAVSALPPDKLKPEDEHTQLNLFMYQATYNSGWRNMAEPSLSNKGLRLSNPPLAIDLHYLLSAYGSAELHTEILLGYGMQLMHENPILGRDAISTALKAPSNVPGSGLPSSLRMLSTSKLAEQVEMIKITPELLNIEDISKLWAAFGTRYRPTAAYKITVVLIESSKSVTAALPVKGRKIYVTPFKKPVIETVASQSAANQPILQNQKIFSGYKLVLTGVNLSSNVVEITIDGMPLTSSPDTIVDDNQISFLLPADLNAGLHELQVVHGLMMGSPPAAHTGVSSDAIVFGLSSTISNIQVLNPIAAADSSWSATIKFDINPAVNATQKLTLYMNKTGGSAQAYSFPVILSDSPSPPDVFPTIEAKIKGVVPGNYLIRVQVDGAESALETDADGKFIHPSVSIS
jgi:hypothetical protein